MSAKRVESGSLGKLPPRHTFALNPRQSARVGRCPDCRAPTEALTLPLPLRIEPDVRIAIRINCRHYPHCVLIADRHRLEGAMAAMLMQNAPSVVGHDYQVIGAAQTRAWEAGRK